MVIDMGPYIGYYAQPSESELIVKPQFLEYAREVFAGTGLQITIKGQRHLGAVIELFFETGDYITLKLTEGYVEAT